MMKKIKKKTIKKPDPPQPHQPDEEEEEQVFIASAKGRNGPESPYTQIQKRLTCYTIVQRNFIFMVSFCRSSQFKGVYLNRKRELLQ